MSYIINSSSSAGDSFKSVVPLISKFKVTPPLEPPPLKPLPAVTPVISPVFVVKPESLLKPDMFIFPLVSFF